MKIKFVILSLIVTTYLFCSIYQPLPDSAPLNDVQKWLVEYQIPYEIASELPYDLANDLKSQMEDSNYIIGDLEDLSTNNQDKFIFNIIYENIDGGPDDNSYIKSYYIQKNTKSFMLQTKKYISCLWDKDELTLDSFTCFSYDCYGDKYQKVRETDRAMHTDGINSYDVQFSNSILFNDIPLTVLTSTFIPKDSSIDTFDSIQYVY